MRQVWSYRLSVAFLTLVTSSFLISNLKSIDVSMPFIITCGTRRFVCNVHIYSIVSFPFLPSGVTSWHIFKTESQSLVTTIEIRRMDHIPLRGGGILERYISFMHDPCLLAGHMQ
jgi:hypothetical protein